MEALNEYLTKLASDAPVPGGGSAAMVVGAAACALVAMVARICAGSPKYDAARELTQRLIAQADALHEKMLRDRVRDEAAFQAVVAARGNKETMQRALCEAAAVPLEGVSDALTALHLAAESIALGNANLISDLGCAAEFAYAALAACAYNVRINHKFMRDANLVESQRGRLAGNEREAAELLASIRKAVSAALQK